MSRLAAWVGYGALALALHLAAFAALAPAIGGMQAAGAGGADRITLAPASAQVAALAKAWSKAPVASAADVPRAASPPPVPKAPDTIPPLAEDAPPVLPKAPRLSRPDAAAPQAPKVAETTPPPPAPPRTLPEKRPERAARKDRRLPRAAVPASRAKGQGGGARAGAGGSASVSTPGGPGAAALRAQWGGEIAARIERQKRYPDAADGAVGRVGVTLRVTGAGQLAGAQVTQSSGDGALDQAALEAVRRAAPFPPAPGGGAGPFDFAFTMVFRR